MLENDLAFLIFFIELQKLLNMTQRSYELQFTHEELTTILQNMLRISKTHKPLHPSQQRNKYAGLFDWLVSAMGSLLKQKQITANQLVQQQQQLITTSLTEMIELTRRECLQKSLVLEMILEYLISTLNAYWKVFENASKEISYEYEHNSVKIEKEYISEIKRLQLENQELKKDKEHRWRNMFMLIKDNRVYRKKNKKLMKTIHYELQKGRLMTQQMINQQFENEKIKAKLDYLQEETFNLEHYMEMTIKLVQLEKKVKKYPIRCKKMLKNDLINIEISQIKNLHDKIHFIIKAVEETGEIIDEIYDEDVAFSNFHYNISTQTENTTEEKAVNTTTIRFATTSSQTYNRQHAVLTHCDTLQLKVRGLKGDKKENVTRESKNVMFINHSLSRFTQLKKQQNSRFQKVPKKGENIQHFALCQAIKVTIYQGRISYISTYNTQILNGIEFPKHPDQKEATQIKFELPRSIQVQVQTDPPIVEQVLGNSFSGITRSMNRKQSKININLMEAVKQENRKLLAQRVEHFEVCREVIYHFDPSRLSKSKEQIKMKIVQSNDKQNGVAKPIDSQKWMESEIHSQNSQKFDKPIIKDSPVSSKITIKKTIKNQQLKRSKIYQDEQNLQLINLQKAQPKKYQSISIQTQKNFAKAAGKSSQKFPKQSLSSVHSKNTTIKAIQSVCEVATPATSKTPKKQVKTKQFNRSMNSLNSSKVETPKQSRNKSSILSIQQLKNLQSYRISKLKQAEHKRTVTESNELFQNQLQSKLTKKSQAFKRKALHRISEDVREIEHFADQRRLQSQNREKGLSPLPFFVSKEGDFVLRDMDFRKGLQKILKNMDMRRQEILNNQHTLKSYLVSYFKCLYGRQLYQNFINFLINTSEQNNQELIICFNKLTNSKLPEPYLIDLFKTFIIMLNKCYLINEPLTSQRIRLDLLTSMVNIYYEQDQSKRFVAKMNRFNIHNFSGWFICLQDELRNKVIYSELYHFLSEILIQSQDSIIYSFIEELGYFIPSQQVHFKNLIRSKTLLGKKTAIHRFVFFCLRYGWRKMLTIQQTIEDEYLKVLGLFSYQKSLYNISSNMMILSEFKNLYKCMRYWLPLKEKYGSEINSHLLMLCELVIMQYRMKVDFPISKELRFINLACEGLQKKLFHQEIREGLQSLEGGRNYSLY